MTGTAAPAGGPGERQAADATRQLLGRGSWYTLATAAPAVAGTVVLPFVTRLLPAREYAVVAVCLVVVQVGLIVLGLGLGAAITRSYILDAAGPARAQGAVLHGTWLAVALGAVAAGTSRLWSGPVLGVPWSPAVPWACVAAAAGSVVILGQSLLRGADRVRAFVLLALVANLAGPVTGLVLLVVTVPTPADYAIGLAAGQLAAAVAALVLVVRSGRPDLGLRAVRRALGIGLPTLPHQIALYVAVGGLVLVAQHQLGRVDSGRTSVVLTLGVGATVLIAALNNAWAPAVYRAAPADRPALLDHSSRRIALLAAGVSGAIALAGPWLLAVVAPAGYERTSLVLPLALVTAAAVPSVLYLASAHLVFASGRTLGLVVTTPLSVVAGLVVAATAADRAGLVGVALGYPVSYLCLALFTTLLQRRVSATPWRPPVLLPAWTLALGATLAGGLLPTDGPWLWVRAAACTGVGVGTVLVFLRAARG
ncbi:lipopolysaccharide biosynthesis protein [Modestobacter sp. SYSU DS0875]